MSYVFKNVTFNNVGCTLCNEPHKSLDCPFLRSIIEMEVSSSASADESSSSSDSHSPTRDFSLRRQRYRHGSHCTSRSPRRFDRDHSPDLDYSRGRDYHYRSPGRNNNYRNRQYNPSYNDRRYSNSNGFSLVRGYSQDRYPNHYQNRQFQDRYQGGNYRNNPNNYNNDGYGWNQGSQRGRKGQFRIQQQLPHNNLNKQAYGNHSALFNGNDGFMGLSNHNSTCSLSDVSIFVTHDGVTFGARRNQGFPNSCTVK